ncbi:DUF932 domain-containing protein [Nocardia asteroides]
MSRETYETLNTQTLIGYTDKRGMAWHYRADSQGVEPNHYPGAIPVADVERRLFDWDAIASPKRWDVPAAVEEATGVDGQGRPVRTITGTDQVIWRSDRPEVDLGTFRPGYEIHQFKEVLLEGLAEIITPDGLAVTSESLGIGSAGVLREGRQAWVQIETPNNVSTPEGVDFRPTLLAASSHDGSLSTTFAAVATIVVCDNTMAIGLSEARESGRRVKIRHSRNSQFKINDTREALGLIVESAEGFAADIAELCRIEVSDQQFRKFLAEIAPIPPDASPAGTTRIHNRRAELHEAYHSDRRIEPWKGTAFGLLQLANTWRHHLAPIRKGTSRVERNMSHAVTGKTAVEDAKVLTAIDKVLAMA